MPTAPLGVCRVAVAVAEDVADPPTVAASPTAVVSRMLVGPSFSVVFDGPQSACEFHPLVGSISPGVAAEFHPGSLPLGLT